MRGLGSGRGSGSSLAAASRRRHAVGSCRRPQVSHFLSSSWTLNVFGKTISVVNNKIRLFLAHPLRKCGLKAQDRGNLKIRHAGPYYQAESGMMVCLPWLGKDLPQEEQTNAATLFLFSSNANKGPIALLGRSKLAYASTTGRGGGGGMPWYWELHRN